MIQRSHGVKGCEKQDDTTPKRKAGPALLQKQRMCSAVVFEIFLFRYKSAVHLAPTG